MTEIAERLKEHKIILPAPAKPAANYTSWRIHNGLVYISGQLPMQDGKLSITGIVGEQVREEQAVEAARLCAINILAQVNQAVGLEAVTACLRLGGFVASPSSFTNHPAIINGASDLIVSILGKDIGTHTRFAVGAPSLPLGSPVEVDALFAYKPE